MNHNTPKHFPTIVDKQMGRVYNNFKGNDNYSQ